MSNWERSERFGGSLTLSADEYGTRWNGAFGEAVGVADGGFVKKTVRDSDESRTVQDNQMMSKQRDQISCRTDSVPPGPEPVWREPASRALVLPELAGHRTGCRSMEPERRALVPRGLVLLGQERVSLGPESVEQMDRWLGRAQRVLGQQVSRVLEPELPVLEEHRTGCQRMEPGLAQPGLLEQVSSEPVWREHRTDCQRMGPGLALLEQVLPGLA